MTNEEFQARQKRLLEDCESCRHVRGLHYGPNGECKNIEGGACSCAQFVAVLIATVKQ